MKVTIQTERLLVMKHGYLYSFCSACGDEVRTFTIAEAASLAGIGPQEICREIEGRKLHFIETTEGSVLVCVNSLNDLNVYKKP